MALALNKSKIGSRIVIFVAIFAALGAIEFFKPLSLAVSVFQSRMITKPVSGETVIVAVDAESINKLGQWPWTRDKHAAVLKSIDAYRPKRVLVDFLYNGKSTLEADRALRTTLESMKAPVATIAKGKVEKENRIKFSFPSKDVVGSTPIISSYVPYFAGYIWSIPTLVKTDHGSLKSIAYEIAQIDDFSQNTFNVDYSYDPNTIPVFPAKDVLAGSVSSESLKGKNVIFGVTAIGGMDIHTMPVWGDQPGAYFQVLGAETLKDGLPVDISWWPFFLFAIVICALHLTNIGLGYSRFLIWFGLFSIIGASSFMSIVHIGNDLLPAFLLLITMGIYVARQKAALLRSQRNTDTGLMTMTGYMVDEVVSNAIFIGASVQRAEVRRNHAIPIEQSKLMKEVGRRLSTVIDERQLTHNEDGQLLWEMPSLATPILSGHLEGLRQLFAQPFIIDGHKIDVDVFFGVDRNVNNSIKHRMADTLKASSEARETNATFKIVTSSSYEAYLKAQFAKEFDAALANGDAALMLEAQEDLATGDVHSAEASLRWTHPIYGQIATAKLFEIAKDSGNLKKLSMELYRQAIEQACRLDYIKSGFTVSVKISTEIIGEPSFQKEFLSLLEAVQCLPQSIILDIVDVHDHLDDENALNCIRELQSNGIRIGVGNFGYLNSDIDLLNSIRPNHIFLIKSFSQEILGSDSSRIFIGAAFRIAEANGVVSTADGVEDRDILAELKRQGCNRAQGKIIAMPLNINDFVSLHFGESDKKFG